MDNLEDDIRGTKEVTDDIIRQIKAGEIQLRDLCSISIKDNFGGEINIYAYDKNDKHTFYKLRKKFMNEEQKLWLADFITSLILK